MDPLYRESLNEDMPLLKKNISYFLDEIISSFHRITVLLFIFLFNKYCLQNRSQLAIYLYLLVSTLALLVQLYKYTADSFKAEHDTVTKKN